MTIVWSVLIFCVLIFIHELGHFISAKLSGMTVHEFSIGMGPKIFGFGNKTKYSLRLLPIGGYVKLEGEDGESNDLNAFCNKSAFKRFIVLVAGALMNIILGFLIFIMFFSFQPETASNRIGSVMKNSSFEKAGIAVGDKIVKLSGEKLSINVHTYNDISLFIYINGNAEANITFEREKQTFTKSIKPLYNKDEDRILYGFTPEFDKLDAKNVFYYGFWQCIYVIKSVFISLILLLTGAIPATEMSGPIAIVGQIGEAAKYGFLNVLYFAGYISVNLGVMNLLPIPALDGGRILFLIIEKVRRKKMKPEHEGTINFIFFCLLLVIMFVVTLSDIFKLGK